MDYGITKKRKTITFEGIHQEIEKKLSMVTNFSIDIENPTLIKYIVDTISQSDYPINFVLVNDELTIKNGYYELEFNQAKIKVQVFNEMVKISNTDINLLKTYIEFIKEDINRVRKSRETIKYYIFKNNKWNLLEGSPKRSLNSVFIVNKLKQELITNITNFLQEKELYNKLGITYKYNILFHGLPGTGKTSLVAAIASEFNYDIAIIPSTNLELKDDSDLVLALSKLPDNTILLIEDVENLLVNINLTAILDGICVKQGLISFMTSNITNSNNILVNNHKSSTNNPLIRPLRIDYKLEFTWAKKNQIIEMFSKFYSPDLALEFFEQIKTLKLTISLLQEFFFQNRTAENLFLNLENLKEKSKKLYPDNSSSYMY